MNDRTRPTPMLLWTALALGAAGVVGAYLVARPERFWANWVLWFIFLFTLGLGSLFIVALPTASRLPAQQPTRTAQGAEVALTG